MNFVQRAPHHQSRKPATDAQRYGLAALCRGVRDVKIDFTALPRVLRRAAPPRPQTRIAIRTPRMTKRTQEAASSPEIRLSAKEAFVQFVRLTRISVA